MKIKKLHLLALTLLFGLTGCGKNTEEIKTNSNANSTSNEIVESSNENTSEEKIVKLTTTTSVNDSGLMDYLRDDFKKDTGLEMEIV
ncbi:MAG: tungsten ABC transporter substrate-binding protein, partial [Anaerococcus vaginalis]|nr:tungsten ABC transporter substrate-binding protein [Anaerococcus vaginalis]